MYQHIKEDRIEGLGIKRSDFMSFIYVRPGLLHFSAPCDAMRLRVPIVSVLHIYVCWGVFILHKHFGNAHYRPKTLTHTTTHTGQGRTAGKIASSTSCIEAIAARPLPATGQILQTPGQADPDGGQQLGQGAAGEQRHDDEEEDLDRVAAHVLVDLAQEMADAVDEAGAWAGARRVAAP